MRFRSVVVNFVRRIRVYLSSVLLLEGRCFLSVVIVNGIVKVVMVFWLSGLICRWFRSM